jgi:Xaa-Pro dipeptidase
MFTDLYRQHLAELGLRYADAMARHGIDAVVIHSGRPKMRTAPDDQWFPLRPVPHFQHWLPLHWPDCALVVEPGIPPRIFRLVTQDFWEQPAAPESELFLSEMHVTDIAGPEELPACVPPGTAVALVAEDASSLAVFGLDDRAWKPALIRDLDALRVHKSAYEVACLAEANRRAALGHRAVAEAFRDGGASELDLHLTYLRATAQDDAETPYKNIVALDRHAAVLHHIAYGRGRATAGQPAALLLDAGATCLGYCSDITRTWVRPGAGSAAAAAFAGLVTGVEAMQQRLCDGFTLGQPYEALHDECHRQLTRLLFDVGLLRRGLASDEEALAAGVSRVFLPHGLGHSLGLQCHDVGCALRKPRADNLWLRNTADIEPGQVFTIEPGVYFIAPLLAELRTGPHARLVDWPLVDALAPFGGVRIEDDLHVLGTPGQLARNLTREHLALAPVVV